jgi:hypothetical protein
MIVSMSGMEDHAKIEVFSSHKNFHRWFHVHHQKRGRFVTKSPGCENLEKCDSTKLERDRFQNKHARLAVQGLHHENVMSTSNLKMTSEPVFHSLVQLEARKT